MRKPVIAGLLAAAVLVGQVAAEVRLKDIVDVEGVRGNDLVGYGLVVGLNGTGDGIRNSPYTEEAFSSLLERLGINVQGEDFRSRNVAAVIVTAALPPFARPGSQIDVSVSAIGDATSLLGGSLVMTPLKAGDGEIYAVAQGPVLASGLSASGPGTSVTFGAPTAASIPQGARVEREVNFNFGALDRIRLALKSPDATTAMRIEAAINAAVGPGRAVVRDPGTIDVSVGADASPIRVVSAIENLPIEPEQRARVVIDQKSGTVVLGADVRISRFAVTQGNLTIAIRQNPNVSQPNPFSRNGDTIVVPNTDVTVDTGAEARIGLVNDNVSLADLIQGLNALGVGPRELIDILTAIKAAGALHADIVLL
jgi:flagellar P-ring protein precursor FlgI